MTLTLARMPARAQQQYTGLIESISLNNKIAMKYSMSTAVSVHKSWGETCKVGY